MEKKLTVNEKLDLISKSGWSIAWDGCHKLYFLQDQERVKKAKEYGYDIYEAPELKELYKLSCSLRFVSRWGLDNSDFDHKWNIGQFEEG